MFEYFFGKRKTPQEMLREHQRFLNRSIRELDRERGKLELQEKKTISELKAMAKTGNMSACKVMAKDLVRTRKHVQKFYGMRTSLQGVSLRIQTLSSNQQMAQSMMGATKAMKAMNSSMNLPGLQKILMEFEKQSEIMDMKEDIMGDVIDDSMISDSEDEEEETEQVVQQVLDEIGIQLNHSLASAPTAVGAADKASNAEMSSETITADQLLQQRLNSLRKD
ncbi:hypothetical protein BB559_003964 [Furculomyces boomerangus]|uniref:Uncharacterized protein n=2 Tax=Harpellales TaxID=61421 RepID=A0A2T9YHL3_9FUNG|nr:hypothetical protein BB559_003964 [Furculomyces boomerangus]PVZ99050.1 hypothetical protein BB558_004943 [Smittium angustum]